MSDLKLYSKVEEVIDGAFNNCLFCIQAGTTAYFIGSGYGKRGLFRLTLFGLRLNENGEWRNNRFSVELGEWKVNRF